MLKETLEGQTHYFGDGCKEHPIEEETKNMTKDTWREELHKRVSKEDYDELYKLIKAAEPIDCWTAYDELIDSIDKYTSKKVDRAVREREEDGGNGQIRNS